MLRKATQVSTTPTMLITASPVPAKRSWRGSSMRVRRASWPFVALIALRCSCSRRRDSVRSARPPRCPPGEPVESSRVGRRAVPRRGDRDQPDRAGEALRVLQEREFQRLGGTRLLKANIRVITATDGDLRKAVERSNFAKNLFSASDFDINFRRYATARPISFRSSVSAGNRQVVRPATGCTDPRWQRPVLPV